MIVSAPGPAYQVVVVGGGPAGLAAALGARQSGADRVLVVDREPEPGGILQQCIHTGFGLHVFGEELTGPEYAERYVTEVLERDVDVLLDSFVLDGNPRDRSLLLIGERFGSASVEYGALVLCMGCRERTRGALRIPGTRPSGIYTAGLAQKFVNMMGVLPGRRIVILGSGDIGLIMARRLTLEGCEVLGVYEVLPYSSGLNRNIVQCLDDFGIPLHLSTTVSDVGGRDRVQWVDVAPVDKAFQPIPGARATRIRCDTLLLSVGLIPENELSERLGVKLDLITHGPVVDSRLMTSVPGVFACGNVLHVHDVVDWVAEESREAGGFAAEYAIGRSRPHDAIQVVPGQNVRYAVPHTISREREQKLLFRVTRPLRRSAVRVTASGEEGETLVRRRKVRYAFPAEMMSLTLRLEDLGRIDSVDPQRLIVDVLPEDETEDGEADDGGEDAP